MSTLESSDSVLLQRGTELHSAPADMSTAQDTDLLLISRGGANYKCTVADLKDYAVHPAGGVAWESIPLPQPLIYVSSSGGSGANQRLVDCSPDVMCLAVTGGIARTVNGKDWTYTSLGLNPPYVFYGGNKTWLTQNYKSLDDGLTWTATSTGNGLIAPNPWNKTGGSSFVSPVYSIEYQGPLYLNGIAETTDGGDTWVTTTLPSPVKIGWFDVGGGGGTNAMGMIVSCKNNGDPVFYFLCSLPEGQWSGVQSIGNYTNFVGGVGGGGYNRYLRGFTRSKVGGGLICMETTPIDLTPVTVNPKIQGGETDVPAILLPAPNYDGSATLACAQTLQYMAAYNTPNTLSPSNVPVGVNYNSYPQPAGTPNMIQQVSGFDGFGPMTIFKNRIIGFNSGACVKQV